MSSDLSICDSDLPFMHSDHLLLPFFDPAPIDGGPDVLLHDAEVAATMADYGLVLSPASPPPCHHPLDGLSLCQQDHLFCSLSDCLEGTMKRVSVALSPPLLDAVSVVDDSLDFPGWQHGLLSSPESCLVGGDQMWRACSTGDLQQGRSLSSPNFCLADQNSFMDEANHLKVVATGRRYSAEERKERILKYRAKRTQRNFTKTIKYACRKTLADSRPRIRGRFARNDDTGEPPATAASPSSSTRDDDNDLWLGLPHEDLRARLGGVNCYGQTRFYCTYGYD